MAVFSSTQRSALDTVRASKDVSDQPRIKPDLVEKNLPDNAFDSPDPDPVTDPGGGTIGIPTTDPVDPTGDNFPILVEDPIGPAKPNPGNRIFPDVESTTPEDRPENVVDEPEPTPPPEDTTPEDLPDNFEGSLPGPTTGGDSLPGPAAGQSLTPPNLLGRIGRTPPGTTTTADASDSGTGAVILTGAIAAVAVILIQMQS